MTAAHVVHSMDEITVKFLGGETMPARGVSGVRESLTRGAGDK